MKKMTMLLALGATVAMMPSVSKAAIAGSAHDFYTSATTNLWAGGNTGLKASSPSVCGECHDVHKSPDPTKGPLWIHAPSSQIYKTYDHAGSETFDALGLTVSLGTSSKACLSCHDGTVGINQQLKLGLDGTTTPTANWLGNTNAGPVTVPAGYILAVNGNDLTHVHPIGISYDQASTALATRYGVTELLPKSGTFLTSTLTVQAQLKGPSQSQMECSTCHDIHNTRTIPHGQSLCLSCHIK
jgi:cytochrome c553